MDVRPETCFQTAGHPEIHPKFQRDCDKTIIKTNRRMWCGELARCLQSEVQGRCGPHLKKEFKMLRYMSAIAFAAGALSIAGSAQAQCAACELFPPINNTQSFTHAVLTNAVNVKVDGVHGDLKVNGTAVANNLSIDAGEGTTGTINNNQSFASYGTNISSTVNVGRQDRRPRRCGRRSRR